MVQLVSGGNVSLYNALGTVQLIADMGGWFTDGSNPAANGSSFSGLTPHRILDTRDGTGGFSTPLGPQNTMKLAVAGQGGVPASGAPAVVLNVAVTKPKIGSYLTLYPEDARTRPDASNLN